MYIHDKDKVFPWRLRLSFAIDIARALAYLHARKCIHRDLKGENLLVTSNGRLKITDFGFARIAARNADESKRLTFCGTDSYMSPEILLGDEFDLPTDIFSFGIILCEISARKLADERHFKRTAPTFGIDAEEVHKLASPGCPPAFLALCLDCLADDPNARPTTRVILERLREIEAGVLLRPSEGDDSHVGSVKFMTGKRPGAGLRIPSFGMGIGKDIRGSDQVADDKSSDDSDEELLEVVKSLSTVDLTTSWNSVASGKSGESSSSQSSNPRSLSCRGVDAKSHGESTHPLLDDNSSSYSQYSTTVIRSPHSTATSSPSLASVLTVRPSPDPNEAPRAVLPPTSVSDISFESYHTAHSLVPSTAAATEGGSTIRTMPLVHRFSLIKPGAKRQNDGLSPSRSQTAVDAVAAWNPLDLFFSSGLLVAKCDICFKRLGWKPVLECDDCGLRSVITSTPPVVPPDKDVYCSYAGPTSSAVKSPLEIAASVRRDPAFINSSHLHRLYPRSSRTPKRPRRLSARFHTTTSGSRFSASSSKRFEFSPTMDSILCRRDETSRMATNPQYLYPR
jgi:LIM domain kinase 1